MIAVTPKLQFSLMDNGLSFANCRLLVWTADVVEFDPVIVDIVEDGETGLLTSTVRLRLTLDSGVGPGKTSRTDGLGTTVGPLKCVSVQCKIVKILRLAFYSIFRTLLYFLLDSKREYKQWIEIIVY